MLTLDAYLMSKVSAFGTLDIPHHPSWFRSLLKRLHTRSEGHLTCEHTLVHMQEALHIYCAVICGDARMLL